MECFRKNQEALLTEVWNLPAKMKILPILSRNCRKKSKKKKKKNYTYPVVHYFR